MNAYSSVNLLISYSQMGLLAIENPYVQHLVGNILVAVSDFIVASVCYDMVPFKFTAFAIIHLN